MMLTGAIHAYSSSASHAAIGAVICRLEGVINDDCRCLLQQWAVKDWMRWLSKHMTFELKVVDTEMIFDRLHCGDGEKIGLSIFACFRRHEG